MFESEIKLRTFLENATERLTDNGFLILTFPDARVLVKRLQHAKELAESDSKKDPLTFGNELYSVKFEKPQEEWASPFGIQYGFYLEDAIGTFKTDSNGEKQYEYVPEFLVHFGLLEEMAKEYNLHVIHYQNFINFYEEHIK